MEADREIGNLNPTRQIVKSLYCISSKSRMRSMAVDRNSENSFLSEVFEEGRHPRPQVVHRLPEGAAEALPSVPEGLSSVPGRGGRAPPTAAAGTFRKASAL